ncbi:zinc-binding dehydrogenase, partial [Aromatoleum toluclasticum]|uniref:zinc-binding dehydrogenase n=1 Tax=Aromatoleum toluclasticum TaxID=92003 RepID=UPI001D1901E6
AGRVIVTAKYDQQAQFAQAFGADVVVRGSGDASVEEIRSLLDGGAADIVIETVGGHAPTLGQATDIVRTRGEVLVLGLWEELVPLDSWKSVLKDVTYRFCLT